MAIFIEFVTGSGLAVLFYWVLHYKEAAYIIFGVGILLSLATYLVREEMENTREGLLDQYCKAHETTFAIAGITDPECQSKAQEIMSGTMKTSIFCNRDTSHWKKASSIWRANQMDTQSDR